MSAGSEDLWGELRSWHAQEHLRGRHLGPLLDRWHRERPEELFEAAIPYCLAHMRQRDQESVHPYSPVTYFPWVDHLLREAMDADRERRDEDAISAYARLLCFKPDCVPAHLNLYRLRHRDTPIQTLLSTHDWEAHGPYGLDSWENVKRQLIALDPRTIPQDQGTARATLAELTGPLMMDIEHQSTIYPSTLATIQLLIMLMDRQQEGLTQEDQRALLNLLHGLLFFTLFSPYHRYDLHALTSRDEARRAEAIAAFSWPVDTFWSFVDPIILRFPNDEQLRSAARMHYADAQPGNTSAVARLFFEKRSYHIYMTHTPRTYADYETCKLPCLRGESFSRETHDLVCDNIPMYIFQSITAGIPVFERLDEAREIHRGDAIHPHEALLWHLGHLARRAQAKIASRIPKKERWRLSAR